MGSHNNWLIKCQDWHPFQSSFWGIKGVMVRTKIELNSLQKFSLN